MPSNPIKKTEQESLGKILAMVWIAVIALALVYNCSGILHGISDALH